MTDQTVAIYCLVADLCRHLRPQSASAHRQRRLSDAQILTTALLAARFFGGNLTLAQQYLQTHHQQAKLDKSGFCRRLHALTDVLHTLFHTLGRHLKTLNTSAQYVIDSAPVAVCDNIRIRRSRLVQGEPWRGYAASKRRYYYGVKLHLLVTADGLPVELCFTPASVNDVTALQGWALDLPAGSVVYADAAYTDYQLEDAWLQAEGVRLRADRRNGSQRPHEPAVDCLIGLHRKAVETTFSGITQLLPRKIHAVTQAGFLLKLLLFVFAYTIRTWLEERA